MGGLSFDFRKALQALYYLQSKADVTDKLSLLKLLFLLTVIISGITAYRC